MKSPKREFFIYVKVKTFQLAPAGHSWSICIVKVIDICFSDAVTEREIRRGKSKKKFLPWDIPVVADVRTKGFVFGIEVAGNGG